MPERTDNLAIAVPHLRQCTIIVHNFIFWIETLLLR